MKVVLGIALSGMLAFNISFADPIKHIIYEYNYRHSTDMIGKFIRQHVSSSVVPASYYYRDYSYKGVNDNFVRRLQEVALQYIGIPYRFGGNSAYGIDCSAFTMDVFRQLGINLPRTAEQQSKYGKLVMHKLKPGDLLFFKDTYKSGISHVGIYIGDGKMIDASSVYGRVVVENIANNPYFMEHFAFAKRLVH